MKELLFIIDFCDTLLRRSMYAVFRHIPGVMCFIAFMFITSCYQDVSDEESSADGKLKVITRSASSSALVYPIHVFAFDKDGVCRSEKILEQAGETVNMGLPEGDYHITAVSGLTGYTLQDTKSIKGTIAMKEGNFSPTPLSIGHADVSVKGSSSATIQMSLQVASLEMTVYEVPDSIEEVSVSIDSEYGKVALDGTLSDAKRTVITCEQNDDTWTTGRVYMLPGAGNSTGFSISVNDGQSVETYSYTYQALLKAGTPYILNGTFSSGFSFQGFIESSGWSDEIVLDFNFGPGIDESGGENNGGNGSGNQSVIEVDEIPEECSLWEGHVVAVVKDTADNVYDVLLISLAEWEKVSSAYSTTNPEEAFAIAESYNENGLDGWDIPTKDEAKTLKDKYNGAKSQFEEINTLFVENDGVELSEVDNGKNARYLCDESKSTYTFKSGSTSVSKAGATVKYHLRLVKRLRLRASSRQP